MTVVTLLIIGTVVTVVTVVMKNTFMMPNLKLEIDKPIRIKRIARFFFVIRKKSIVTISQTQIMAFFLIKLKL